MDAIEYHNLLARAGKNINGYNCMDFAIMLLTAVEAQINLDQVVERIFAFRQITRLDQRLLMSIMLSKEEISPGEHMQINRIFDAVKSGKLQVVD